MKRAILGVILLAAFLMHAGIAKAQSYDNLTVTAKANIYGAGKSAPPAPGGHEGGVLPPRAGISFSGGASITFPSVTGQIACCEDESAINGPDGGSYGGYHSDIGSYGGISGVIHDNRVMFLIGVFIGNSVPSDPAPARRNVTYEVDAQTIAPALHQTFFIGDGRNRGGSLQSFVAPQGATRLYLGFADSCEEGGLPGCYVDNNGQLQVQVQIQGDPPPPPPPPPPIVYITGPTGSISVNDNIIVTARADDSNHQIEKVQFFVDSFPDQNWIGTDFDTDGNDRYQHSWTYPQDRSKAPPVTAGTHYATVRALGEDGSVLYQTPSGGQFYFTVNGEPDPYLAVPGNANIFGAGKSSPPAPAGQGAGVLPTRAGVSFGAGASITFPTVTGQIACCEEPSSFNGPDGGSFEGLHSDISSYGGISGIVHDNRLMFLVGVFIGNSVPGDPAPARRNVTYEVDAQVIRPALHQTFFIGNGRDRGGNLQSFVAPPGATRLYLGFADSCEGGLPGCYVDNQGQLQVQVKVGAPPPPPPPTVIIIGPTSPVEVSDNIIITARAEDPYHQIEKVQFFIDSFPDQNWIGTDFDNDGDNIYRQSWTNPQDQRTAPPVTAGTHYATVRALDENGNVLYQTPPGGQFYFTVNGAPPPPPPPPPVYITGPTGPLTVNDNIIVTARADDPYHQIEKVQFFIDAFPVENWIGTDFDNDGNDIYQHSWTYPQDSSDPPPVTAGTHYATVRALGEDGSELYRTPPGGQFYFTVNPVVVIDRIVRVEDAAGSIGGTVRVPIELVAQGDENALGFSLEFDENVLTSPSVSVGNDAGGASLNANYSQTGVGRLGVAIALPAGRTFAAGDREVAIVDFQVRSNVSVESTQIHFVDLPVSREVSDANANVLGAQWLSGTVQIVRGGYECDVAQRFDGDGKVSIVDWVQEGRFVAGLDGVTAAEFQRADTAPRMNGGQMVLGDGKISIIDWVECGLYAAGLDPLTSAGGPVSSNSKVSVAASNEAGVHSVDSHSQQQRVLRLPHELAHRGGEITLIAELDAEGDENALGFSVSFDPTYLTYVAAVPGDSVAQGALININDLNADNGRIGVAMALPTGSTFNAGTQKILNISFVAFASDVTESTMVAFIDDPIAREISDASANVLDATYDDGSVTYAVINASDEEAVLLDSEGFQLKPNYPNPFNASTSIEYSLQTPAHVTLRIFNLLGQEVENLVDVFQQPGSYTVQWSSSGRESGIYFYQLQAENFTATRKLTVLR